MKKTVFGILISLMALSAFSAEYRVKKVQTLGPLKHKVIFQSTDLKKIKNSNVLKGKLVTQWGVHVYEIVNGLYSCDKKNVCTLTDYERVATFEKCVVRSPKRVDCKKRIGGSNYTGGDSRDIFINESPDTVYDEYDNGRRGYDHYSEYPERDNDSWEFGNIVLF